MTNEPTQTDAAAERIRRAAIAMFAAQHELREALAAACPGPHTFRQSRDGLPAWCRACGRTQNGMSADALRLTPSSLIKRKGGRA